MGKISVNDVEFEYCDFNNPDHLTRLVELIEIYMTDPMGQAAPLNKVQQLRLVDGFNKSYRFVVFCMYKDEAVGLVTFFENFSTFKARPYLNVHDVIVEPKHRGKGFGKLLLEQVIEIAKERKCCKVTLEVREDNYTAQTLYIDHGFADTKPKMYFWTKLLE